MYVAVVMCLDRRSDKLHGDWASFVSDRRDIAIEQAVKARESWERKTQAHYDILVGELTSIVKMPRKWAVVSLATLDRRERLNNSVARVAREGEDGSLE